MLKNMINMQRNDFLYRTKCKKNKKQTFQRAKIAPFQK